MNAGQIVDAVCVWDRSDQRPRSLRRYLTRQMELVWCERFPAAREERFGRINVLTVDEASWQRVLPFARRLRFAGRHVHWAAALTPEMKWLEPTLWNAEPVAIWTHVWEIPRVCRRLETIWLATRNPGRPLAERHWNELPWGEAVNGEYAGLGPIL